MNNSQGFPAVFFFRLSQIKGVLQKLGNLKLGDLASHHKAALTRERSNNEIGVSQSFLVGSCSCAQWSRARDFFRRIEKNTNKQQNY